MFPNQKPTSCPAGSSFYLPEQLGPPSSVPAGSFFYTIQNVPATTFQSPIITQTVPSPKKATSKNPKIKTCNCSKTKCLKLYCDCFARGEYCGKNCSCQSCHNTSTFENERQKAISACLIRNADAFKPKIHAGIAYDSSGTPIHLVDQDGNKRGCSCKRSSCLKNYCECFRAGVFCVDVCCCRSCKNYDPIIGKLSNSPDEKLKNGKYSKNASIFQKNRDKFDDFSDESFGHSISQNSLKRSFDVKDSGPKIKKLPGLPPFQELNSSTLQPKASKIAKRQLNFNPPDVPDEQKLFAGLKFSSAAAAPPIPDSAKNLTKILSSKSTNQAITATLISAGSCYKNPRDQQVAVLTEFNNCLEEILRRV